MRYDDAALERALDALALEEAPVDLHARIMHAVAQRHEPAFRPWELWIVGAALALCTWSLLVIPKAPLLGQYLANAIVTALTPSSLLWLALGAFTAFVLQRLSGSRLLRI